MPCRSRRRAFEEAKVKDPTIYYFNSPLAEIDNLSRELSLEELVERYFKPFLQYTEEYPKDFVDNLVNILRKYNG